MIVIMAVDPFAQFLTRLEVRNVFADQRHGIARLGIAPDPRRPKMKRKAAKTSNFDPFATS